MPGHTMQMRVASITATSTPDRMLTMTWKSCNRKTSAKERMMVLLCEQETHQQIGVDHGWKITEMTLFQKKMENFLLNTKQIKIQADNNQLHEFISAVDISLCCFWMAVLLICKIHNF